MGHIVNLARESRIKRCLGRPWFALLGENVSILLREPRRFEQIALYTYVEELGLCPFVRPAHRDRLRCYRAAYFARGIVEIAGKNGLRGANNDARRFQFRLHTMRAEIAFCRGVAVGINIERVVGTGLHAALTADTPLIVEVDDSVRASVEG